VIDVSRHSKNPMSMKVRPIQTAACRTDWLWSSASIFLNDEKLRDNFPEAVLGKQYSLALGILVGVFYVVLRVRSSVPPAVALVGLLGMLGGEQLVPIAHAALTRLAPPIGRQMRPPPTSTSGD
jgi:XapX domain-containing protein